MKRHLRIFCNHHQDDEFEILSMTEFVVNKYYSTSTKMFSFMITKEFSFRINYDVVSLLT